MNNSKIKVRIVCPLDIEYKTCKDVLKLNAENELAGRYISSRKENNIKLVAVKAGVGKII